LNFDSQNTDQDVKGTKPITAQFEKYQVNREVMFMFSRALSLKLQFSILIFV